MEFAHAYSRMVARCHEALPRLDLGSGARESAFDDLALELFEFQQRWNDGYRRFCAGKSISDWKSIPAVPTAAFKDLQRPVACFPVEEAEGYFETSGTTGEVRGRHYFYDFEMYRTAIEVSLAPLTLPHIGMPLQMRKRWLPGLGERSSLRFMFELLSGEDAVSEPIFDQPVILMGTALSFLNLFEAGCAPLPEGSWVIETGGYKGSGREIAKPDLYAMFGERLGVPPERVINEYGMTELSSQFYAAGVDGYHSEAPWARVVVRDPESGDEVEVGEAGYVTIYDLANVGSAMAVATQDIAVRREGGMFELVGRDPAALPRGCSRAADEFLSAK